MRWAALPLALLATPAAAATLTVGGTHPSFGAALADALDGDTVRLPAGEFYECAIIKQHDLVIEGAGPATVLTDSVCAGKAILVAGGASLTVRDLTLARARVPDGNGAGIRLEGGDLLLERVRFDNNQAGVMSGLARTVRMTGCSFTAMGRFGAVLVDNADLVRIEGSQFEPSTGTQVSTGAARLELLNNRIAADGATAVLAAGPVLRMAGNTLTIGPARPPRDAAIMFEGDDAELTANRLDNRTGTAGSLLLDWGHGRPVLRGNLLGPDDSEVGSSGLLRHRAGGLAREVYGNVRHLAAVAVRKAREVLH